MAFFDDFSKRVSQVSQGAMAKTKSVTDTAKYRSQISDEERKITDSYRRIGELFYSVRGEQDVAEYQTLIKVIDDANAKIAELNHMILVARGVAICPNCGAEVNANAAFCVNCGTKLTVLQPERPTQPEQPAEPEQPTEPEQPEQPAEPEQPKMRFCTNCGAKLSEDQKFCTNCGTPV